LTFRNSIEKENQAKGNYHCQSTEQPCPTVLASVEGLTSTSHEKTLPKELKRRSDNM
jgi:hypothetical protein